MLSKERGSKPISKGPRLKKIEVGPPAAKRHVGKQKPKVLDDSQGGSSQALRLWTDENHCMPKAIVGDEADENHLLSM